MVHLPILIIDLALILTSAALVTLVFKKLKQPVVLGYIIAGFLVGPNIHLLPTVVDPDSIKTWADIGVIFLLFGLGLEFSFKKLIKVGGVASLTALIEVTCTLLLGYGVGKLLGWGTMDCLFLGGILAIASTTIIIRAFDELGVRNQKFAGLVTGILVIEDLVAVLLMVLLSTVAVSKTFSGKEMISEVLKLGFFLILWFVGGIYFIPTLFRKIKLLINEETLLIISLALCLVMVVFASFVGFSSALGAFIMGSILAETTKAEKIEHLTASIKTFFGAIFFVSVGMMIDPQMLVKHYIPIIAATAVLLFGKPFFVTIGALISGQPIKVAVQSGMSLSQIGEFSFIIASMGLSLNVTSDFLYPIAVAVSVLTTFTTPYMIKASEPWYRFHAKILPHRVKKTLESYSSGAQHITDISDWKKVLRSYFINVSILSVIIVTIILLSINYLEPILSVIGLSKTISAVITLVILSPFLWALAFRRPQKQAYANVWLIHSKRGPLIMLQLSRILLMMIFIGFLLLQFFSFYVAMWGIVVTFVVIVIFNRKIRAFYGKIESRFIANFHERESGMAENKQLAPWDTHIVTFELSARSPFIGKTLQESQIRETFGVNIVLIERGDYVINVPKRINHLYPHDKVSVIGTDEQLTAFKSYMETSVNKPCWEEEALPVSLHNFRIRINSPFEGKSILTSGIRERSQGLIVGIERNGERILNPESNFVFERGDLVWIVGNEKLIQLIIRELDESIQ